MDSVPFVGRNASMSLKTSVPASSLKKSVVARRWLTSLSWCCGSIATVVLKGFPDVTNDDKWPSSEPRTNLFSLLLQFTVRFRSLVWNKRLAIDYRREESKGL
jgi:hypothetical protein